MQIRELQIKKTEPWSDLIHDEKVPVITFHEEVRKIIPHPLQYDVCVFSSLVHPIQDINIMLTPTGSFENEPVSFATCYIVGKFRTSNFSCTSKFANEP